MSEEKKKEYSTVKIPKEVHDKLKESGAGISKSISTALMMADKAAQAHTKEIADVMDTVAQQLEGYGFFDISFRGVQVISAREDGDNIIVLAELTVGIPNSELRKSIIEAIFGEKSEAVGGA